MQGRVLGLGVFWGGVAMSSHACTFLCHLANPSTFVYRGQRIHHDIFIGILAVCLIVWVALHAETPNFQVRQGYVTKNAG